MPSTWRVFVMPLIEYQSAACTCTINMPCWVACDGLLLCTLYLYCTQLLGLPSQQGALRIGACHKALKADRSTVLVVPLGGRVWLGRWAVLWCRSVVDAGDSLESSCASTMSAYLLESDDDLTVVVIGILFFR